MSIFYRPEKRSITSVDVWGEGGGPSSLLGSSLKGSLELLPVYAAVRLVSSSISTLPVHQQVKTADGGRKRVPLTPALDDPHEVMRRPAWLGQAIASLMLRGNAYGYVVSWTAALLPERMIWLHPDKVRVDESGPRVRYFHNGVELERNGVLHIQGVTVPGSVVGVSPIAAAKMAVEAGMQIQTFTRDWFRNKAIPSGIFKNTGKTLAPGEAETISDRFRKRIRAGEPLVYGSDWDYTALSIDAEDAAFIKASRATASQIAVMYGLPPESIGGETGSSLTYSTVEQNTLNLITYGLRPWFVILEESFSWFLLPKAEQVRFNPDAMIRPDTKTRNEIYRLRREIGMNNIDELRALDDLEPLPDDQGQDYTPLRLTPSSTQEAPNEDA